jgi:predicted nucleic acid-binding protein
MLLDATISLKPNQKTDLFKRLSKQVPSYRLLEKVSVDPNLAGLVTSPVALAEIISVLFEEALEKKMYDQGIPFKYWERERYSEKLSESEQDDISDQLRYFESQFIASNQIEYVEDAYDFADVTPLVLHYRIDEYDALLVSTAIHKKCAFFITEDERLRKALRRFTRITLTSAQNYLTNISRQLRH